MDTATGLEVAETAKVLRCAGSTLTSKVVIIAAGSAFRTLGIPGEAEYVGKGVSHCASCDAPFFVGKDVCVVGGGDSALDEAAVLAAQVGRVTVIHRGPSFSAQQAAIERLNSFSNIETAFNTEVVEIVGGDTVSTVRLRSNGSAADELSVAGVFIFVGLEPNTAFVRDVVDLDPTGHIAVDAYLQTSVKGVFAAGDIRQHSARQLVAAAGDGATAAVFAAQYLRSL
jgi:thioredoxin reductase (NADPH)